MDDHWSLTNWQTYLSPEYRRQACLLHQMEAAFEEGSRGCHIFALIVFHSSDLLQLKVASLVKSASLDSPEESPSSTTHALEKMQNARRFFTITSMLPLKLQMVLCNRISRCCRTHLLSKETEPYFKQLATLLQQEKPFDS